MEKPQITAYLKTHCGWSGGVRAVLAKYDLPYTEKDIIQNPAFRWEMETKSGQPLSPCVEINGEMLADVSGEEIEQYLVENGLVNASDAATDVPTNAPCASEQHGSPVDLRLYSFYPGGAFGAITSVRLSIGRPVIPSAVEKSLTIKAKKYEMSRSEPDVLIRST